MTNVHLFPKNRSGTAAKANRKERGLSKGSPAGGQPAFHLSGPSGEPVDVLMAIIQAGGIYLIPTQERPVDDLPTTHLLRTIDGLNALTDAANVLIYCAMQLPAEFPQEAADTLVRQGKQAHKMIFKLDGMLPSDDFIMTVGSYGPDLMAEYATNAAIIVASSFALDIMAHYDESFIKTGKDKRKAVFKDFQGAYREAHDECLTRSEGHEFLIKELTLAQRALKKLLKEP